MNVNQLLMDKSIKAIQKREQLSSAIENKIITVGEIKATVTDDKGVGIILEAMEEVSRKNPEASDVEWLNYACAHILSDTNTVKREASRVVGNIACLFPDSLTETIHNLLKNTKDEGTVVRWGSAYALGRIILIPQYATSGLFDTLIDLAEQEAENGVRNQYLAGIKKAKRLQR